MDEEEKAANDRKAKQEAEEKEKAAKAAEIRRQEAEASRKRMKETCFDPYKGGGVRIAANGGQVWTYNANGSFVCPCLPLHIFNLLTCISQVNFQMEKLLLHGMDIRLTANCTVVATGTVTTYLQT